MVTEKDLELRLQERQTAEMARDNVYPTLPF